MPRFIIGRDALLAALAVKKAIETRQVIPILGNVHLDAQGDSLSVTGSDQDLEVTQRAPAEIEEPGAFTLPGAALQEIVRRSPAGSRIRVSQSDAEGRALLTCGKSKLTLYSLPAVDFPRLALTGAVDHTLTLTGKALAGILAPVEFCISTEETRYYLNGTYLHPGEVEGRPVLRACATDGYRLARAETPDVEGVTPHLPGLIVPRKTVHELRRLADAAGDQAVTVEVIARQIRVTIGATTLVSKLIEGTFPDPGRFIPLANNRLLTVGCAELAAAVGRLAVVTHAKDRDVKLTIEADRVGISANRGAAGMGEDEVAAEYDGPAMSIGFAAPYLTEILDLTGGDSALLQLGDPSAPALIRTSASSTTLFVLMPMRVA